MEVLLQWNIRLNKIRVHLLTMVLESLKTDSSFSQYHCLTNNRVLNVFSILLKINIYWVLKSGLESETWTVIPSFIQLSDEYFFNCPALLWTEMIIQYENLQLLEWYSTLEYLSVHFLKYSLNYTKIGWCF